MTDVVEIAKTRRDALAAEIAVLGDLIRMAETLLKHSQLESNKASDTEDEKDAVGNGAEAEREDLPARELKAEDLMLKSRATCKEPAPDRKRGFSVKCPPAPRRRPSPLRAT